MPLFMKNGVFLNNFSDFYGFCGLKSCGRLFCIFSRSASKYQASQMKTVVS